MWAGNMWFINPFEKRSLDRPRLRWEDCSVKRNIRLVDSLRDLAENREI